MYSSCFLTTTTNITSLPEATHATTTLPNNFTIPQREAIQSRNMSACGSAPAPAPYWLLFWVEGGSVSVDSRTAEEKEEDEEDVCKTIS
jgi:hypothetical protein